jgi:hypothetical protein
MSYVLYKTVAALQKKNYNFPHRLIENNQYG